MNVKNSQFVALSPWHTIGDRTGKFEVKLNEVEGCGASIVSCFDLDLYF